MNVYGIPAVGTIEYTPKEVLNAREVAELLGVHVQAVYESARKGDIPYRRMGKKRLIFSRSAIMSWLECKPA